MKNVIKLFSVLFLVSGVVFHSCKPEVKEPVKVTEVKLSKTTLPMVVGDKEALVVTVIPDDAADKSVTWESNNEDVATVDNSGNVEAKGIGKARITVRTKDGNFTASCEVTVVAKIENDYKVKVVAAFYDPVTGAIINTTGMFWGTVAGGVLQNTSYYTITFKATLENTSGMVIPKGTPIKYKFLVNDKNVDIETMQETTDIIESTIENDVQIGGIITLSPIINTLKINNSILNMTDNPNNQGAKGNTICVEILQIGKEAASPTKKGCNEMFFTPA